MLGFGECPDSKGIIKDFEVGQVSFNFSDMYHNSKKKKN